MWRQLKILQRNFLVVLFNKFLVQIIVILIIEIYEHFLIHEGYKYTLFTGLEVPIGKNCAQGLRGRSFSKYGLTKASE